MSSFNGQMKEYTGIAIDRFDGKNLQCTAFFLSHCHKDHMVGLNYSSFVDRLSMRDGVFLYCSEITRLLLITDNNYSHLIDYICVLKVGVPQSVRVPSNSKSVEDYQVDVTPISAGHCPGSVMFLFEGHEGTCLYTGDFRWEINHAARVAAFKQENRFKRIKSIYVDTTFCIPEAYHIPKRSECVDAAVTLVSDWLQRSSLNVVLIFCPARYGHEHLLMELSKRLNEKIHVPEWKVKIYDQIPDLKNVFTCNSNQARIHACSARVDKEIPCFVKLTFGDFSHPTFIDTATQLGDIICHSEGGYTSCLPCLTSREGRKFSVLKLRPSTMWFTSEKSKSKTDDLIVTPVSQRGLYRICYSMHSSYCEIRDMVSFLQPEHIFPNVIPVSDTGIEVVQERLISFQKYFNKARVLSSVMQSQFQPLGTLKKTVAAHTGTQQPACKQGAESSDELVFSSQETNPEKVILQSFNKSLTSSAHLSLQNGAEKLMNNTKIVADESSSLNNDVCNNSASQPHLSYKETVVSDEEFNLFSDDGDDDKMKDELLLQTVPGNSDNQEAEDSLRIYISGDSDTSVNDSSDDCEWDLKSDYDTEVLTAYSAEGRQNIPEVNKAFVDKVTVSQSKVASLTELLIPSQTEAITNTCPSVQVQVLQTCISRQDSAENIFSKQKVKQNEMKTTFSRAEWKTVKSASECKNNNIESISEIIGCFDNVCSDQNEKDDDNCDIVYSSQVALPAALIESHISMKTSFPNASTSSDQLDCIPTSQNELVIEQFTQINALSDYTDCNSKEAVTVLSSSDDSQNMSEQESQTLWSVSYSLDHFTPNQLFQKNTDHGTSDGPLNVKGKNEFVFKERKDNMTEQLDCSGTVTCDGDLISTRDLSLKKVEAVTEQLSYPVLQNSLCKKKRRLKIDSSLKRKCTTSTNNESNSDKVKQFRNGRNDNENPVFIKQIVNIKDDCVTYSESNKCSYSLQETSSIDRNVVKFQSKYTSDNSHVKSNDMNLFFSQCKLGHTMNFSGSHKHTDVNFRENGQISKKSEWVDLAVEMSDDVIDLTLESSQ